MKKIIISCAASKSKKANSLIDASGKEIIFVANPNSLKDKFGKCLYFKPDDLIPGKNITWRSYLLDYNLNGNNHLYFSKAADLYEPPRFLSIYSELVDSFGRENVFILSAGWGLIRSDFLLPYYNITFSKSKKIDPGFKRKKDDPFLDFNFLIEDLRSQDEIHFLGGDDYTDLFYSLTGNIMNKKTIHYVKENIIKKDGYEYCKYKMKTKDYRVWVYLCATDLIKDNLNQH